MDAVCAHLCELRPGLLTARNCRGGIGRCAEKLDGEPFSRLFSCMHRTDGPDGVCASKNQDRNSHRCVPSCGRPPSFDALICDNGLSTVAPLLEIWLLATQTRSSPRDLFVQKVGQILLHRGGRRVADEVLPLVRVGGVVV